MKAWINRDYCDSSLSACESCFGQFVRTGVPDRGCILATRDDGSESLTVFMHSGKNNVMLVIPPDMRDMVAYDGWTRYVDFQPAFSRDHALRSEPLLSE
jgi:hypothetical protein